MLLEVLLIFPLYVGIFIIFYRFKHVIKMMSEIEKLFSDMSSEDSADEIPVDKRDFLTESDKVVEKLYEKCVNPPPVKVNKQDALEMGKPVCPVVIEMYAEGLKTLIEQMPFVSNSYTINAKKLKASIASDKYFCDNLAIKIGSKMIEQVGENSVARAGLSLAAMTWDAVEPVQKVVINERSTCENLLSTRKFVEGVGSDNRASEGDKTSD